MMNKIRILMLEDSPEDAELVRNELEKTNVDFDIELTDNMYDFSKALDEFKPQIILSDYLIPNFSGLAGLEIAREKLPDVPYIFVSGHIGEDRAIEALRKGATDYVLKDRMTKLVPIIMRVLKDVGELNSRKLAEESLRQYEESYGVLFENNLAGIFNSTLEGKVFRCNHACVEILGYDSTEDLLSVPLPELYYNKQAGDVFISSVIENKTVKDIEVQLTKKNGDKIWALANIGVVHDSASDQMCIQGIIFDITERKIALEEIIKAKEKAEEADRMKSDFLAHVSHEIRTPLNVILSYHNMLRDELSSDIKEENDYMFNAIELAGRRLVRTIDLILNMSVIENGKMDLMLMKTNLYNVLKNMHEELYKFAEAKGLKLNLINKVAEPIVTTDLYIIEQVFQNLIENAVKYTNRGEIDVTIYRNISEEVCVDIKDAGIGITPEYITKIFQPFSQEETGYTRKYEGLGLGLALVKKYLDILGYKITVVSQKGKGSIFTVRFNNSK
ncbi:MAG: ATP-binding protein [Ignavibacteriaceae bacterium]|nr:ATP-binding protein [Ignavibacteriaceae bacterium]